MILNPRYNVYIDVQSPKDTIQDEHIMFSKKNYSNLLKKSTMLSSVEFEELITENSLDNFIEKRK